MNVTLTVRSFQKNSLDLFWEFKDQTDTFMYEWRLLRSEGAAGPWSARTGWIREVYYFRDNEVPIISRTRQIFYILEVRERGTTDVHTFGPSCLQAAPDLVGMELIRQVRMEIRHGAGRWVFILPKRSYGARCISCWDEDANVRMQSNCPDCFDTSFVGGYLSPIKTEADVGEMTVSERSTDQTQLTQANGQAYMPNFPPVKAGDLLITAENERYRVESVQKNQHRSSPYSQDALLHLLPRGDIEYDIPIDVGPLSDFDSDIDFRVRTNPTNHERIEDDELVDLLGMFGQVVVK